MCSASLSVPVCKVDSKIWEELGVSGQECLGERVIDREVLRFGGHGVSGCCGGG